MMKRVWRKRMGWLMALVWVGVGAALLGQPAAPRAATGEAEKVGPGRSLPGQVTVEPRPAPSARVAGFDAERVWSEHDDWEPALAVDPSSDYVYQLTTRYSGPPACPHCGLPVIVFRRSADGGGTWEPDRYLAETRRTQNDPMIEVASDGAIYAAYLNEYRPGVRFTKSTDHGRTWSRPVTFTRLFARPRWNDRPVLAISADGQHVYLAFNASDSYVVASHDFGQTWSAPVRTNQDGRYWFHSAGAVAPDGTVYFGAVDYSQDYTGDSFISVLRSADGGATWTAIPLDVSAEMPDCDWAAGCYFGFLGPSIGLAADRTGALLAAYHTGDAPGAPQRMYARRSADGLAWSERQPLSGENLEHNAFPAVAAGRTAGDFRVAWQGSFDGRPDAWNTWYRRSVDGGRTWDRAARLSDLGEGAPYRHADGFRFPYGDYIEMAVDRHGRSHVIWGEGFSYFGPGGSWYTRGR
ncbi:sialidase family protein [Promineifilum sp.]|uniref:sialidase family protein n=1 Tax=Promineifilum sp. TaxID=2664178 RepID=UPI0035B0B278